MQQKLNEEELSSLVRSVFSLTPKDRRLAVLVDVPDDVVPDNDAWRARRRMAFEWVMGLKKGQRSLNLESVVLVAYPNVHSNNADLPETAFLIEKSPEFLNTNQLALSGKSQSFENILSGHQIILAPTQFSTTAPLKLLAKKFGFRAATMPGFSEDMIPALRLDYSRINRRVERIKQQLDPAIGLDIQFSDINDKAHSVHFDLRHRSAHASGGRLPDPGTAGNLPSGECYIVPYEGEKEEPSRSEGTLPVQFEDEIVLYRIEKNKAIEILSNGPFSDRERKKIADEPAYANIAEIGFGVLRDFGVKPTGEILLDEKLGLHIAFGRSDHFGGAVGVKDFSSPDKVIHIDRIYIPETQPNIHVDRVILNFADGTLQTLMENGTYPEFRL
ncbi:MAG: hypothetical protein ABIL68_02995 [bacterium]